MRKGSERRRRTSPFRLNFIRYQPRKGWTNHELPMHKAQRNVVRLHWGKKVNTRGKSNGCSVKFQDLSDSLTLMEFKTSDVQRIGPKEWARKCTLPVQIPASVAQNTTQSSWYIFEKLKISCWLLQLRLWAWSALFTNGTNSFIVHRNLTTGSESTGSAEVTHI